MKFLPSALFSLSLLLVSGVLMFMHWRSWKTLQREERSPVELDYRRRQFRRRMMASGMIGVVGIVLFIGMALFMGPESLIPWINDLMVIIIYWFAVVLITLWMILLAFVDVWATRQYLTRICEDDLLQQTQLHANLLRQKRAMHGMGNPAGEEHASGNSHESH
jgi:hypothetical protein